jgi:hypothetical protein
LRSSALPLFRVDTLESMLDAVAELISAARP